MTTDLTIIDPNQVEAAADPATYVVQACERAKAWLADALEHGDIEEIVELKSQAEAIRIYTTQKQLGKDAELAAAEIVRRAERGIGLAIRKGQEVGEIARPNDVKSYAGRRRQQKDDTSVLERPRLPSDFVSQDDLTGNGAGIYGLTDGISDECFAAALVEGKAEGNLSRANVVRKVRAKRDAAEAKENAMAEPPVVDEGIPPGDEKGPAAAARRRELMRDWAANGWTSAQIGERLGITERSARHIAREEGITVSADVAMGRGTRKSVDSNRIVRETVAGLEGLELALDLVSFDELDPAEIPNWTKSLAASIRVLNRLNKQLKEMVQ